MNWFFRGTLATVVLLCVSTGRPMTAAAGSVAGSEWAYGTAGKQYVRFSADNQASGNGGCNRFFGRYELSGSTFRIGPLASTRKACAGDVMEREQAFLRDLERARSVAVTHRRLSLKDDTGAVIAELARRDWD